MLFEGEVWLSKNRANNNSTNRVYEKSIEFENGFIGVSNFNQSGHYIGGATDSKEVKILSNIVVQNFTSFSFSGWLESQDVSSLIIGAWYNSETNELTLYREPFGRTPLYYITVPGQGIFFSNSLSSLASKPELKFYTSINAGRLASYATFLADSTRFYSSETFYTDLKTVLPGHSVTLKVGGQACRSIARMTYRPSRWSHLKTIEEFGEEFRSKFLNSVRTEVSDSSFRVASHLSGGMDSSSVSAAIKFLQPERPLQTIYNKSNTLDTDENLYALSVSNKIGSEHHEIIQSKQEFDLVSTYTPLFAEPCFALISPSSSTSMMKYAKSLGCDMVVNGHDGDSIVGSGLELINAMFELRQWDVVKNLLRERVAHYSFAGQFPKWDVYSFETKYNLVVQNFLFRRLAPKLFSLPLKEFASLYGEISKHFTISYSYFAKRGGKSFFNRLIKGQFIPAPTVLRDEIISQRKANSDQFVAKQLEEGYREEHKQSLLDVYTAQSFLANEQTSVLSDYHEIVNSSPFYNHELFELCMAVPDRMKFGEGIGRAHFREAMKGILPDDVRLRSGKTHVRSYGQEVILRMHKDAESLILDSRELWEYVDRKKYDREVQILRNEKIPYSYKANTWFHISKTVSLAIWLNWLNSKK